MTVIGVRRAMARFGSLPEAQRMQLLAMFARVDEANGRD